MENDKVLIAIEWSKYLNLYKYNSCLISEYNIVECALDKAQNIIFDNLNINALERALPVFERDMDAVILEFNKSKLKFNNGIYVSFQGILNIIPLSQEAFDMLSTRIPPQIKLSNPLPARILSNVLFIRRKKYRREAIDALINHYSIMLPNEGDKFIEMIHKAIEKVLNPNSQVNKSSILYNLLTFDITPSFIPEGNIESIIKIGCIVYKANQSDIENITGGDFYNVCMDSKSKINAGSILNGYKAFNNNYEVLSSNARGSINKLLDELKKEFPETNTFLIYYIYLSLNRLVSKNEFNLELVDNDLREIKLNNEKELFYAMVLFCSVHSIDRLYESIHKLNKAPLFSNKVVKSGKNQHYQSKINIEKKDENIKSKYKSKNINAEPELGLGFDTKENFIHQKDKNKLKSDPHKEEYPHRQTNESSYTKRNEEVLDNLISGIDSKLEIKSSKDKNLWKIAQEKMRDLKEVNLGSLEGILREEPFVTKSKKPNACATRILDAIKEIYIP